MTIMQIEQRNAEIVDEMDALLKKVDEEERDISEEEEKRYSELEQELAINDATKAKLEKQEVRKKALEDKKKELEKPANHSFDDAPSIIDRSKINDKEFRNFGEFMFAVSQTSKGQRDKRLDVLYDTREQTMANGTEGGFLVPQQFSQNLLRFDTPAAIFRPRSRTIPAGTPPDASITIPALDQGSGASNYGGVDVTWIGEGDTKPETAAKFREITLSPHEVAAHIPVTDKLLRNWTASSALLEGLLRDAIISAEETAFLSGNGAGKPLGITNSPASLVLARATASTIAIADVQAMYARARFGNPLVWVASQTILPQLMTLTDGTNYVWAASAVPGVPPTLYGIPVVFNDRIPGLGTTGDLMLLDLSYYLIKDGSGPFVAMSEHVYFTQNKTVIKAFWNVDGQPWLDEPIILEGSTANTVSPFVILSSATT